MLPDADWLPTMRAELFVSVGVTRPVALDLPAPPVRVRPRFAAVIRAPVPEAAVHEDRDAGRPEHKVRPAPYLGYRPSIQHVAETERVDGRPDRQFAGRV